MKIFKLKYLAFALIILLQWSCQNEEVTKSNSVAIDTQNQFSDKICASQELLEQQLKDDPAMATRMNEIEAFTKNYIKNNPNAELLAGNLVIPVQVNVLYNNSAENVSWNQIQSQIDVLNKDFKALNTDYNTVPAFFQSKRANIGITFTLNPTIQRKLTTNTTWPSGYTMMRTDTGGIATKEPSKNLNIYVCDLTINGLATSPGAAGNPLDGVVIDYQQFGTLGSATAGNLGRTGSHEVGHWMGLKHIWGDANCGDDSVADTPVHNSPNYGNPIYPHYSTCAGTPIEMTMNYMDYTGNNRYMFSLGQKTKIDATFAVGGPRASFRN
ncbi:MAG: M43 family zinc metalloprotease [Flavobacterium sp.]|uniref:M43 family zinc metalloprotease n=1 Tax=Flavobacterium sp. TaxID=239 RepID=UPI003264BA5D